MVELRVELPTVTVVLGSPGACDAVERSTDARPVRVADGEMLIVGEVDRSAIRGMVDDPYALVDDVSDGWVSLVLEGAGADDVFARLSDLRLPAGGWIQGEVARAAAKVLVEPGRLTLLVPSNLATHVEERLRTDAVELLTR